MDWEKHTLRISTAILLGALVLRLFGAAPITARVQALDVEDLVSVLLFLEAGRVVKLPQAEESSQEETPVQNVSATVNSDPQLPLAFSWEDMGLLEINNLSGYNIDPEQLLSQPLTWDLTQEGPAVLILHTHATESYQNTAGYVESASYRTLEEDYNMISIGGEIARILEEGGVQVLHDTALHDNPSYNNAYSQSRQAIKDYLAQYPSIRIVLDIHRDAAEDNLGNQIAYTSDLGGETAAQLMLVMGSDAGGLSYPNWQENLSLAVKLQTALQRRSPGICRPLSFRAQRYNQDMHPGALLIEVGSAGNTHDQAVLAARALAQGILDIAHGTVWQEEQS